MTISRRRFVEWAAAVSALAAAAPARARLAAAAIDDRATTFRPELFPSQKAVWDHQVWMAKLGPKYTGNKAHTTFVDFLATEFKAAGCEVVRDSYRLPRHRRLERRAGCWLDGDLPASRLPSRSRAATIARQSSTR